MLCDCVGQRRSHAGVRVLKCALEWEPCAHLRLHVYTGQKGDFVPMSARLAISAWAVVCALLHVSLPCAEDVLPEIECSVPSSHARFHALNCTRENWIVRVWERGLRYLRYVRYVVSQMGSWGVGRGVCGTSGTCGTSLAQWDRWGSHVIGSNHLQAL